MIYSNSCFNDNLKVIFALTSIQIAANIHVFLVHFPLEPKAIVLSVQLGILVRT